jgi:hypothetical protein
VIQRQVERAKLRIAYILFPIYLFCAISVVWSGYTTVTTLQRAFARKAADEQARLNYVMREINATLIVGRYIAPVGYSGSWSLGDSSPRNYAIVSDGDMMVTGTTTITGDLIVTGKIIQK